MGATVNNLYAEIERCDQLRRQLGELVARTGRLQQLQLATTAAIVATRPSKPTRKTRTPEGWATVDREAESRTGREPATA